MEKVYYLDTLSFINRLGNEKISSYDGFVSEYYNRYLTKGKCDYVTTKKTLIYTLSLFILSFVFFLAVICLEKRGYTNLFLYLSKPSFVLLYMGIFMLLLVVGAKTICFFEKKRFSKGCFSPATKEDENTYHKYTKAMEIEWFLRDYEDTCKDKPMMKILRFDEDEDEGSCLFLELSFCGDEKRGKSLRLPILTYSFENALEDFKPMFDVETGILMLPARQKETLLDWLEIEETPVV